MPYLLDANVFIQAKNLHYGMDFCPAFWDWLIEGNAAKQVFSIEKVGDEILAIADELADWADNRGWKTVARQSICDKAARAHHCGKAQRNSCHNRLHVLFLARLPMKISYDPEVDALYIRLAEGKHECRTLRLNEEVALNIGEGEELVGIEILDA